MPALALSTTTGPHWASNPNVSLWNAVLAQVVNDLNANIVCAQTCAVNINVDYGFVNNSPLPGGAIGESAGITNQSTNYSAIRGALQSLSKNSLQTIAYNNTNLPSIDPFGGAETFAYAAAIYCAIGLGSPITGAFNVGFAGWSSSFTFDTTVDGSSCAGGEYSLYGEMMHELTECLGRLSGIVSNTNNFEATDLHSWSSSGTRNFTSSGTRYASTDGAASILGYNQSSSGDYGDTNGTPATSAFDAFGTLGFAPSRASQPLKAADWQLLTLIGYQLSPTGQTNAGIPVNSVVPTITGSTTQGQTLSISSNGTWTNSPTFTYQWLQDGVAIGGATSSTYTTNSGDIGHNISLSLTGTGASTWLNSTATSNTLGPIGSSVSSSFSFGLKR